MKTKQQVIKEKYDKKLEDKGKVSKAFIKPFYAIAASGELIFSSFGKEDKVEESKVEKIAQSKLEKTIELTSEVDIDSLNLFDDAVNESKTELIDELKFGDPKLVNEDDDFFEVHSYVQKIKEKGDTVIDKEGYEKNQAEKMRLEEIKRRMIKSKNSESNKELELKLDEDTIRKQLNDLGNVSPTKGKVETESVKKIQPEEPTIEEDLNLINASDATIEFEIDVNNDGTNDYISIEEIAKEASDAIHTNTAPESTIEQIVQQALILDDEDSENETISDLLIEDLTSTGLTIKELTQEINELKDEEVERTIELQLAINSTSSIEEAQSKTDFEIQEKDITPEETTEKVIEVEELSIQDLLRIQRNEGTVEANFIAEKIYAQEPLVEEERKEIKEPEEDLGTNVKPKKWCKGFKKPGIDLLNDPKDEHYDESALKMEADVKTETINELFNDFNIGAKVVGYEIGPTVTTYQIEVVAGTKITKVTKLEDNIKMELQAKDIRIQAPIPGKPFVGIEVPNNTRKIVSFKETLKQVKKPDADLLIVAGQDTVGNVITFDLTATPHMLIAGSTGSGKSVAINTIITSLLMKYTPEEVKMILVDPKMVEFTPYHNIPHLITPVITSPGDANLALKQAVNEMEKRYKLMSENGARNIKELNSKLDEKLPYIVVVIDELADLMMVAAKEVEESIMRITQKARAAGIHMIVATQRPSTDIITGVIKSNIPSRIAFTVSSSIDSRTILDQVGAEKLIGQGDMLISLYGQLPFRGQGSYISMTEVDNVTNMIKEQCTPYYEIEIVEEPVPGVMGGPLIDESDPLYQAAKKVVIQQQKASTSLIQRYLSVGYNKAANIIETLEMNGIVGPANGSKPREVLVSQED